MPTPAIIDKVRQLQTELGETQPSPAIQPEVEDLKAMVDAVMLDPEHAPHYTSLRDRLRLAEARFETDHPQLAASMQAVMNALNTAGL
jgi:hypothetical protein